MISEISNDIRTFVMLVNEGSYDRALTVFARIKSHIMIMKAQYGNEKAFKEIDELMESLKTSLRWGMKDAPDITQKLLYKFEEMAIS